MFAPGLLGLALELLTNILLVLNDVVLAISEPGSANLFPVQGM